MFSSDRNTYRQSFYDAWQKAKQGLILLPVEQQLVDIIMLHPEFHALLDDETMSSQNEFALDENPFLHLSLHLAINEQINTDRPRGIQLIAKQLQEKYNNRHELEHHMMSCLAEILWKAQQSGSIPDENEYLRYLRRI